MPSKHKINDHQNLHFITFATVEQEDALSRPQYKDILKEIVIIRIINSDNRIIVQWNYQVLIPYHKGDKWGYCDTSKTIIIEPQYEDVSTFKRFAWVKKNKKFNLINREGIKQAHGLMFDS